MSEWFTEWFEHPASIERYLHRNEEESSRAVSNLLKTLTNQGFELGPYALDAGCGTGRHLGALADIFSAVIGVDISYLALLNAYERKLERVNVLQADLRKLPFNSRQFNFIASFFSSFGYFADDNINKSIIHSFSSVMNDASLLLLDLLNPSLNGVPFDVETTHETPNYVFKEIRAYQKDSKILTKHGVARDKHSSDKKELHYREELRVFSIKEIENLCAEHSLKLVNTLGDYLGRDYTENSDRLIIVLQRI